MLRVAAGVVWRADGHVLIARRAPGSAHAGRWEFPGGKLEPGESARACLARELREELDIVVRVGRHHGDFRHPAGSPTLELLVYDVQIVSGTPALRDHDAIRWVRPAELPAQPLVAADIPIAEHLTRETGFALS